MTRFAYDLYPRDDPVNGALIRRLTNLLGAEFRKERNGTGSGSIVIRAGTPDADAIDPKGMQYVRVVRIDDDDSEHVYTGFFLEQGDFTALSATGEKLLRFSGAGTLSYFGRSVLAGVSYLVTAGPYDDLWHWFHSRAGAILDRLFREVLAPARPQHPFAGATHDFTNTVDSDGNAWGINMHLQLPVLQNFLDALRKLLEFDLAVDLDPDTFVFHAWVAHLHGADLTGGAWGPGVVRFQASTDGTIDTGNILSDAKRAINAIIPRSDLLVGADDEYAWVAGSSDLVWEGGYRFETDDAGARTEAGEAQLAARDETGDTVRLKITMGEDEDAGRYAPGLHFDVGDTVTLDTGSDQWDWDELSAPVAAVSGRLRPGGDWDCIVELGSTYSSIESPRLQASGPAVCECGPQIRLCGGDPGGTGLLDAELTWDDGATETIPASGDQPAQAGVTMGSQVATDGAENGLGYTKSGSSGSRIGPFYCPAGTTKHISLWLRDRNNNPNANRPTIEWYSGPYSAPVGLSTETPTATQIVDVWRLYEFDVTAPATATRFTIWAIAKLDHVKVGDVDVVGDDPIHGFDGLAARCDHGHLIESLTTAETDTALVLAPDGAGGVEWVASTAGVTDHGALTGLADDDHPQYTTGAEATTIADAEIATHAAAADPHAGYVLESLIDAAGDLIVGSADNAVARLAKGTDGQVLTVDPTTHLLVWATPGGGYTDEQAQDAIGAMIGDTATVDLTYVDATPLLKADVIPGGIKLDDLGAPDDNTDLDASTAKHGLLKKLPGGTSTFLRADGSFAAPAGTATPVGGLQPWAPVLGAHLKDSSNYAFLAHEARAFVIQVVAPMYIRGLKVDCQTGGSGTHEWGLFDCSADATACTKLAGGTGNLTTAGTSWVLIAAASAPVLVNPGTYILILKAPASGMATIKYDAAAGTGIVVSKRYTTYTWTNTPNMTTTWTNDVSAFHLVLVGDMDASGRQWV